MKILDIINQQTNEGALDAFMRGFEKATGKAAPTTARGAEKVAGVEKGVEKGATRTRWERFEDWAGAEMKKDADKVASAAAKTTALKYLEKEAITWMGWANLIGWVAWYHTVAKPRLDADYKSGKIKTPQEYQEKITWLRGQMVTQIILPKVVLKMANWKTLKWLPSRLPWLMDKVGAKNSAAVVAGVSSIVTAGTAYAVPNVFQQFIAESLGDVLFSVTGVAANIADKAYEALKGMIVTPTAPAAPATGIDALKWAGQPANAKQDIGASSSEPVFGPQRTDVKRADVSKRFF